MKRFEIKYQTGSQFCDQHANSLFFAGLLFVPVWGKIVFACLLNKNSQFEWTLHPNHLDIVYAFILIALFYFRYFSCHFIYCDWSNVFKMQAKGYKNRSCDTMNKAFNRTLPKTWRLTFDVNEKQIRSNVLILFIRASNLNVL